ncbi:unnamed protein product [Owenia fusiformis]|uniref:TIR domain-containing protein n=1 Tax=Owenia fusiformis TaxID=6347 RepID=A0A8S4PWR3_OWEFU|nr:unnamed protein product [Owenia fusiformis]
MENFVLMILFLNMGFSLTVHGEVKDQEIGEFNKINYNGQSDDAATSDESCQTCKCTLLTADCSSRKIKALPLDLPQNITTLNLYDNYITAIPDFILGRYYKNLQTLDMRGNRLSTTGQYTFHGLGKLRNLHITWRKGSIMHPLLLKPLKEIQIIDVTGTGKNFNGYHAERDAWLNAFRGLQNSTIEKIIYEDVIFPFILKEKHFTYFKNCQLKELHLPLNRISAIETGFLKYLPKLEILDLSKNMIAQIFPNSNLNFVVQLLKLVHLRVIRFDESERRAIQDLSYPRTSDCIDIELPLPMGLQELNFELTTIDRRPTSIPCALKFARNNKLKVFNAKNSYIVTNFGGPLKGLVHLQHFIYNNNDCRIVPEFFTCASGYFESLQVLDLANNRILLSNSSSNFTLFKNCSSLVYLDISYNNLAYVPFDILKDTSSIKIVNLSGNKLVDLNIDLKTQTSLKLLNLSKNIIQRLGESARNNINSAYETSNGNFTVDLNGNPFMCNCDAFPGIPFINWVKDHQDIIYEGANLSCQYINGSQVKFTLLDVSYMKFECRKSAIVASGISVGFVLVIVGVVAYGYKRRYRIIYIALHLRALLRRNQLQDIDYDFDGFLSYSSLDKTWAINNIYGQLAAQHGYNICVDDRNFRPGSYLSDIIVECISKSNKIILVISQNFLRSGWCKFEMNLARGELATRGRDCLILILKEPVELLPPELISPTLRSLLDTRVYLEWSEDEDRKLLFLRKLQDALGEPRFRGEVDTPFLYQNNDGDEEMLFALTE